MRTRKPSTLAALDDVRRGMSMSAAARKHGIAYTTIFYAVHPRAEDRARCDKCGHLLRDKVKTDD